ncbi:MAG TPA: hypothetical protein VLQ76_03145, partial [Bacteroidales bacterium]|nr:hypothetical protein [Bacteroidales bacterium]
MKTLTVSLTVTALLMILQPLCAQVDHYLPDKPGEWKPANRFVNDNCTVLTEKSAYLATMISLTEWIHRNNEVVVKPVGFDAQVNLTQPCHPVVNNSAYRGHGYQGEIGIHFQLLFLNSDTRKEDVWENYCPTFSLDINNPIRDISNHYDETGFQTGDPPQFKQPLEKALENLKKYYNVSPVEKEVVPGVRIYTNGYLLVFNPDRPEYWIPVTVKEVMEAKLAYYKVKKEMDEIKNSKALQEWAKLGFVPENSIKVSAYDMIKKEYDSFTPEELNSHAFYNGGDESISCISADEKGWPV